MALRKCGIKIGQDEDELRPGETIQFMDVPGRPRLMVNKDGNLEILYNTSGTKRLCVFPIVGNVIEIGLK